MAYLLFSVTYNFSVWQLCLNESFDANADLSWFCENELLLPSLDGKLIHPVLLHLNIGSVKGRSEYTCLMFQTFLHITEKLLCTGWGFLKVLRFLWLNCSFYKWSVIWSFVIHKKGKWHTECELITRQKLGYIQG